MEHSGRRVWYVTEACVVIQQFSGLFNDVFSILAEATVGLVRLLTEAATFARGFALLSN